MFVMLSKEKLKQLPVVIVAIITAVVTVLFVSLLLRNGVRNKAPREIVKFLDEFVMEDYDTSFALPIFYKYFLSLSDVNLPAHPTLMDYYSSEQDVFEQVFYRFEDSYYGYDIEQVTDNFSKIYLKLSDGSYDYPSVGFWYTISKGKIDTWRIARLSPISRYDAEYSEVWSER